MKKTVIWVVVCVLVGVGAYYLGARYGSGAKQDSCTLGTAIRNLWSGNDANRK